MELIPILSQKLIRENIIFRGDFMEALAVTFAVVIGVMLMMLAAGLLCRDYLKEKEISHAVIFPVYSADEKIIRKIKHIERKFSSEEVSFSSVIILVNYSADAKNAEICREFCNSRENAYFIQPEDVEKILSKTFAIDAEI